MRTLLKFALLIFAFILGAVAQDPEYGGKDDEFDKNRIKFELEARRIGNAISSKVVVPVGAGKCRAFNPFSKKPCPLTFPGPSNCIPAICYVENKVAYTEYGLPVYLIVPYKIVGKRCKVARGGRDMPCGPNCFCQTIWCKKKYTHVIRNYKPLGFYRIQVWNKYPCRCECRGFQAKTTKSPLYTRFPFEATPPSPTTNHPNQPQYPHNLGPNRQDPWIPPWQRYNPGHDSNEPDQSHQSHQTLPQDIGDPTGSQEQRGNNQGNNVWHPSSSHQWQFWRNQ